MPLIATTTATTLASAAGATSFVPVLGRSSDGIGAIIQVIVFAIFIIIAIASSVAQAQQQKGKRQLNRRRNPDLDYGDGRSDGGGSSDGRWERIDEDWLKDQGLPTSRPRGRKSGMPEPPESVRPAPERDPYDLVDAVDYDDSPGHQAGVRARRAVRVDHVDRQDRRAQEEALPTASLKMAAAQKPKARPKPKARARPRQSTAAPDQSSSGEHGSHGKQLLGKITRTELARGVILAEIVGPPRCFDEGY